MGDCTVCEYALIYSKAFDLMKVLLREKHVTSMKIIQLETFEYRYEHSHTGIFMGDICYMIKSERILSVFKKDNESYTNWPNR